MPTLRDPAKPTERYIASVQYKTNIAYSLRTERMTQYRNIIDNTEISAANFKKV